MGPIEIDVEPEPWIPPHQQTVETPPAVQRQDPRPQRARPEQAAAQTLSPELMRVFRGNQYMYIFRMLLLIIVALCLLLHNWLYNGHRTADFISISLATVAPGLIVGLWGLLSSLARLKKNALGAGCTGQRVIPWRFQPVFHP